MPSKKHKPEEIIGKLREVEIVLAQAGTTAEACRRIAVSEQTAEAMAVTKMIDAAETAVPTVLGMLVLGKSVRDFLPGAYIQFLRIAGQGASLATHADLWRWLQGDVQKWLAHDVMLIGWGDFRTGNLRFDIVSSLPGLRTFNCAPGTISPLLSYLRDCWVAAQQALIRAAPLADRALEVGEVFLCYLNRFRLVGDGIDLRIALDLGLDVDEIVLGDEHLVLLSLDAGLAAALAAALMLASLGLLLSVHVRQLENFAGTGAYALVDRTEANCRQLARRAVLERRLRQVLGLNVKLLSGYAGGSDINLAIERHEVDGRMLGMSSIKSANSLHRALIGLATAPSTRLTPWTRRLPTTIIVACSRWASSQIAVAGSERLTVRVIRFAGSSPLSASRNSSADVSQSVWKLSLPQPPVIARATSS